MMQSTRRSQAGNAVLYVIVGVLVVAVIGLVGVGLKHRHDREQTAAAIVQTTPASSTVSTPNSTATATAGTDNQSLANNLSSITSSLSQGSKNLSSTNGAVGDQSQQITVPTN